MSDYIPPDKKLLNAFGNLTRGEVLKNIISTLEESFSEKEPADKFDFENDINDIIIVFCRIIDVLAKKHRQEFIAQMTFFASTVCGIIEDNNDKKGIRNKLFSFIKGKRQ